MRIATATLIALLGLFTATPPTLAAESESESKPAPRPNIVLIVADDLGYGDIGAYGQEKTRTPHLDRLAERGMVFTDFYSGSTVCAPSRSVLMTGQHTGRTTVRGNSDPQRQSLSREDTTVAELLERAGYTTGMFGKWGLGEQGTPGLPHLQGFDRFFGYLSQSKAHFYYPPYLWRDTEKVALDENRGEGRGAYSHDLIVEEALAFIDRNAERPFFLYMPLTIPHAELAVPEESKEPYLGEFEETPFPGRHYGAQEHPKAAFAGMVSRMDRDIGRVIDRLKEHGIDENTIIMFTSDNGPHTEGGHDPAFFNSSGPLRGVKRDLYEGGIRVPMIVRWPGKIEPGSITDHIAYFGDLMATASDLAGFQTPDNTDSISFLPTLLGRPGEQKEHDYLYWEFYERGSKQAVRKGKWKAVRMPAFTGEIELYNLEEDLGEANNVAEEHPGVVEKIEAIMEEAHTPDEDWKPRGRLRGNQPEPGSGRSPFAANREQS